PARSYLNDRVLFRCEASQALPPVVYELLREEHIVASKTLTEVGQPANFSVQVTEESTGRYLRGTYVIPDPNPPVLYEGQKLLLTCKVQHGTYLSYQWNLNRKEVSNRGSKLTIARVTEQDAGDYSCSAKNDLENPRISYSNDIRVVVRGTEDLDELSFVVSREDSGYHADVTCQSSRGSPPVSFRLFLNGTVVASRAATSLSAHFYIPIRTGVNYGELQCRVQNDVQELSSNTVTLEVVPVGGEVRLRVDYLYDASSTVAAVLLQCAVAMGTFPEYAWFRNNTRLGEQGDSEVTANRGRSLLLTPAGAGNSGYYHCQVKDSFDNTSWTASRVTLIQVTGEILLSVRMIAMVLGCFLLLLLLGTTCFVVFRLHSEFL
uniref:Ig-like domain-containing protein n=1 Tax=Scleropages formosus TaxID=113540 RepID=A0A8C9TVU0_SCLFO